MNRTVLSILAHPDDAEFLCAGALVRLAREHSFEVHIATMTPGDCGSAELGPSEIARVRREEGHAAARLMGAAYHCLEERDLRVFYCEETLERVTRLLRTVRPSIVFTHSPSDYMLDHEMTSVNVRAACFGAPIPNFHCDAAHPPPLEHIPHLYYCDPIEGKDPFGQDIRPGFCIDISKVLDTKSDMLKAHASQRDWLLKHHGLDQYIKSMTDWAATRGRACSVAHAEGFRQHLGHSYPQDNLLGELLGALAPR
ncbi:MAG: PIG-L deacetylase family protein [Gemmataceae bacterium]